MAVAHRTSNLTWTLPAFSLGILLVVTPLSWASAEDQENPQSKSVSGTSAARTAEVVFTDQGRMWISLEFDQLELDTPYGKLTIPVEDLRRVTPTARISEQSREAIEKAISNLGNADFAIRLAASTELYALGERAYPALAKASKHSDPEIARHAQELVKKLREGLPPERLQANEFDVVETPHSTISGRLVMNSLAVRTAQFGKQNLQLSDVRSLRSVLAQAEEKTETLPVEADPGNLSGLREAIGKKFAFRVTGRIDGSVYGTGVYTTDSNLATAAVHCGALKVGQTGIVRVSLIASPDSFTATTQNGVTSYAWGAYPTAYQVHVPKK